MHDIYLNSLQFNLCFEATSSKIFWVFLIVMKKVLPLHKKINIKNNFIRSIYLLSYLFIYLFIYLNLQYVL